jgi:hypothetical protein
MRAFARSPFAQVAALAWGAAEAMRFWLIPDILLGWIALNRPRSVLSSVVLTTLGSLAGGAWMHRHAAQERPRLLGVPGISPAMIDDAHARFVAQGWPAVVRGPIDGIPYKVYAVESATAGRPLHELVLWTPPARAWRFLVTALGAGVLGTVFGRPVARQERFWLALTALFWLLTYLRYFARLRRRYGG